MKLDAFLTKPQLVVAVKSNGGRECQSTSLLYLCTYQDGCEAKVNGFCVADVKYCNRRVFPQ